MFILYWTNMRTIWLNYERFMNILKLFKIVFKIRRIPQWKLTKIGSNHFSNNIIS